MSKFLGTIERTDVEGGRLLLKTDQGVVYQLDGKTASLSPGQRVEIEGRIAEGSMGLAMIGEVLEVQSHRRLD